MISVRVLSGPLAFATSRGLDLDAIVAAAGLEPSQLADFDGFVPLEAPRRMFDWLEQQTGEPLVGIASAEHVEPQAFDVFRYLGASTPTVGEAIGLFVRWFKVLNTVAHARCSRERGHVRLVCSAGPKAAIGAHGGDYVIACVLRGFQAIASGPLIPARVELRHGPHGPAGALERFFGAPVSFGVGEDAIVWPDATWAQPARAPDATLAALLQRHFAELERKAPKSDRVTDRLTQALAAELGRGPVTMARMAKRLALSTRSLQRRLATEGTQFRAVLDEVRLGVAKTYLRTPGVSIAEVAFMLGFADVSTFHRAFRGWTGQTPGAFAAGE